MTIVVAPCLNCQSPGRILGYEDPYEYCTDIVSCTGCSYQAHIDDWNKREDHAPISPSPLGNT